MAGSWRPAVASAALRLARGEGREQMKTAKPVKLTGPLGTTTAIFGVFPE